MLCATYIPFARFGLGVIMCCYAVELGQSLALQIFVLPVRCKILELHWTGAQ